MARTRAQQASEHRRSYADADANRPAVDPKASKKRSKSEHAKDVNDTTKEEPPEKSVKLGDEVSIKDPKIAKLLSSHGTFPLSNHGLKQPKLPQPDTVLAHVFHALLVSTRISHQIADKTLKEVIQAGYADLSTLEESSWDDRTQVLTKGGYTHYREKTATELRGLADIVRENYKGDLNNLLKDAIQQGKHGQSEGIRTAVRAGLQEIKGIGAVALDVFCDTIQSVWHELAPFLDPRSRQTAKDIGLSAEVEELYKDVNEDPVMMSRLAAALTAVRLEGLHQEFA